MADQPARTTRRIDLDWLRIIAFGLLIFYHVGMVFVPWPYHVKSENLIPALAPVMSGLNPWRLALLFVIAGTATRFMVLTMPPGALAFTRSRRLAVPLTFGVFVIVPPQSYWEVVARHLYSGDFWSFYTGPYLSFARQFCESSACLVLPTWNHLWFVAYLWLYTLAAMLVVAWCPILVQRLEKRIAVSRPMLWLATPALLFVVYRLILWPRFPQTNALLGDWYNHAQYFTMFALGYLIAMVPSVWDAMTRARWIAASISVALFASHIATRWYLPHDAAADVWRLYGGIAFGVYQWSSIVAVLGFGRRWMTRDTAARRYLTDAIFAYYIVHQTIIVGTAFALRTAGLPAPAEAAIIIAATMVGCAASYEFVVRTGFLRPLFGLKRQQLPG